MINHTFLSTLDLNRVRDLELAEKRYNALRNAGEGVQILVETYHRCWSWIKPEPSELDAFADGLIAVAVVAHAALRSNAPAAMPRRADRPSDLHTVLDAPRLADLEVRVNQDCPVCGAGLPPDVASEEPGLRDMFAAAVLAGSPSKADPQAEVEHAYMIAELMLARRKK